jgi:3-hydroxybutyryl-CoA dehydrogenase
MLQENHATDGEMEMVMKQGWGYPMGPLQLLDVIGLDVALAIQRQLHETFRDPALAPARYLESLVQSGHLGRKTGQGFRSYGGVVA